MSKYKIHINPPEPDDKIIDSKKNFRGILKDYKNVHQPWWVLRNFHKNKKLRRFILLIIIVLLTLYFTSQHFKDEVKEKQKIERKDLGNKTSSSEDT